MCNLQEGCLCAHTPPCKIRHICTVCILQGGRLVIPCTLEAKCTQSDTDCVFCVSNPKQAWQKHWWQDERGQWWHEMWTATDQDGDTHSILSAVDLYEAQVRHRARNPPKE